MLTADPRKHLGRGTPDRRCWNCATFMADEYLEAVGDCTRVRWMLALNGKEHEQMVHKDDVCAKFSEAIGRSIAEREDRAVQAGLG